MLANFLPSHVFDVIKRVAIGCWNDGMIHAGNLAYMSMLAIFPFFITAAAAFSLIGEEAERAAAISAVLSALPPTATDVIGPVARNVVEQRSGWLLWVGGAVGIWTVSSLIETIRDILRRAYGAKPEKSFWYYRLGSTGIIIITMVLLILSLFAQVAIGTAQEVISAYFPDLSHALSELAWSRMVTALCVFGSIYLLFLSLVPREYRPRRFAKWPGALLVTGWWMVVTYVLPRLLASVTAQNLPYGSLAGIMITLFFFWLVGLGMVAGAELNAALAQERKDKALGNAADDTEEFMQESN